MHAMFVLFGKRWCVVGSNYDEIDSESRLECAPEGCRYMEGAGAWDSRTIVPLKPSVKVKKKMVLAEKIPVPADI